jgi:hypothetical protein
MIRKNKLNEFKEIYYRQENRWLSDDEAKKLGQNLIDLYKIILRPIKKKGNINEDENI